MYTFLFSIIVLGNSASHFLEMIMLISKVGMLTQTRMGIGGVTFPRMAPMKGQFVVLIPNSCRHIIDNYYLG